MKEKWSSNACNIVFASKIFYEILNTHNSSQAKWAVRLLSSKYRLFENLKYPPIKKSSVLASNFIKVHSKRQQIQAL